MVILLAAGFLAVALDQFLALDPSPPVEENRYLAKMPSVFGAESLESFRKDFERYYRDHLGFRDFMIRSNSRIRIRLGATRVSSGEASVYIGDDDWLYFGYTLRDYMGTKRLDPAQLDWWLDALAGRHELCGEYGAHYLFFAAPVKVSIYPEHLPRSVQRGAGPSVQDQLIRHVGGAPGSPVLDLRPPLRDAKEWHQLYWKTDHHWTSAGGAAAFEAIARRIRRWFPNERIPVKEELVCDEEPGAGPDSLAQIMGLRDAYSEVGHRMRPHAWDEEKYVQSRDETSGNRVWIDESRSDGLKVVAIGDSFMFGLLSFYKAQFRYVRFVDHLGTDYDAEALREIVEHERPDLVLEERAEWGLLEVPGAP